MKITDYRRSTIGTVLGTAANSLAIGNVSFSSNSPPTAGAIPVAIGSNMFAWRDALSFGSNTADVSSVGTMGASSSNTRADHVHRVLRSLSHSSNTLYGEVILTTPGDTVGITSPTAGTLALTASGGGGGGGGGGALVLLEQHTASASATLDFTTCISATYDDYLIEFVNVIPATNSVVLYLRMSTDGGSSYDSGANYSYVDWRWVPTGSAAGGGSGQSAIQLVNPTDPLSNSTSWGLNGSLKLYNPGGSAFKRTVAEFGYYQAAGNPEGISTRGAYESATAVNAFRFLMSSGNIASGTIRVYGIAKS